LTVIPSLDATTAPTRWQDRTGRILMAITAAATLVPFVDGISRISDATGDQVLMEFWRTFAYIVFAGMWALLAIAPRKQRGMWELLLFHKIAVTVQAAFVLDVPNAERTLIADGFVSLTTIAGYVLCRGWHTWRRGALGPDDNR
jgi:peptidoglycan/LPS O-acetylase OafA/YrhL